MPYCSLFYHLVWATRGRKPTIGPNLESEVWRLVRQAAERGGIQVHSVGGMPDHVHVAASVPPSLAVADAVRRVKGGSSHAINQMTGGGFAWQAEYGAVTFAEQHLPNVVAYIRNQTLHHANQSTSSALERISLPDRKPPGL